MIIAATPLITAIVTTYNRPKLCTKAILSLACQTLAQDDYEIIVVDDGSNPETHQLLGLLKPVVDFKYVFQPNSGLASAKNHGLFHASAPIVLFLDDDDLSSPNLLEQHLIAHARYPDQNISILSHTYLSKELANDPLMDFVTTNGAHLFSFEFISAELLDYTYFWGGRTSCKRKYLLSHGVFNPVFKFGFEDIELGYRLNKAGLHVVYWRMATNTMIRKISLDSFLQRCYKQGQSASTFLSLYPEDKVLPRQLQMEHADIEWPKINQNIDSIVAACSQLDTMVRTFPTGPNLLDNQSYLQCLHYSYYRAFRAKILEGFIDSKSKALDH
ncbi:glycosyltransferase [Synechococcus sp. BSF8S]|uniref:glycosyltransferase family 2 protein n=1 Tax=Synechococcales TaxID=1890424 RepID=UPI001625C428|nr:MULTISPECIES: glycosyltransferase family 2 protein [unclassified Synechococcus]MBC1262543.1 glycosyltransferase [Synechococcus sp. BSF8S]MBC1265433.1 glycosyltransferase [Synechococcus sp. BSA11S]